MSVVRAGASDRMARAIEPRGPRRTTTTRGEVEDWMKRIYIAGAIAGESNPERKFQFAAGLIERMGHIAVNPFTVAPTTDGWSYEQYLIADLHAMLDCDEVVALPCWRRSKGATIEVQLALRLNKPVRFVERDNYDDFEQGG